MSDTLLEPEDQTTTTDYCPECKGRPHAPWCSEFEPPETEANQLLPDGISSISAGSEHQPAARGGGDDEWIDKLLNTVAYAQDVDRRVAARLQVKHAVNQHQSLVAEREQWERLKSKIAWHRDGVGPDVPVLQERYDKLIRERNQLRLALEIIRDSFWSENEPFEERVEYLQQTAKDILITVHEQRSTSE